MPTRLPWVLAEVSWTTIALVLLIGGVLAISFIAVSLAVTKRVLKAWTRAANAYGLSPGGGPFGEALNAAEADPRWHGRVDGFHLLIAAAADAAASTSIRVRGGLPMNVALGLESPSLGGRSSDTRIGDDAFDATVRIAGSRPDILCSLDPDGRSLVRAAIAAGWRLEDEELASVYAGTVPGGLEAAIQRGLRLATCLRASAAQIGDDLLARVANDPIPAVRRNALEILGTKHYGAEARAQAIALGLQDPDLDNRFRAAALGNDTATLTSLAREGHMPALDLLLDRPAPRNAARATLAFLVSHGGERSWAWRACLARALGRCPVPGAEDALIAMLGIPDDDLRTAAVEALGTIGTVAAVPA